MRPDWNNPNRYVTFVFAFYPERNKSNVFNCAIVSRAELGNIPVLQQLWLYDNDLTGSVPSELGNLEFLSTLEVEGNDITGTMPSEVCDIDYLSKLGADCSEVTVSLSYCMMLGAQWTFILRGIVLAVFLLYVLQCCTMSKHELDIATALAFLILYS